MSSAKEVKKHKRIILVTGTPAVGKTAVSSLLTSKLDATHIDLTELVKQERLISGVDEQRETLIADLDKVSKRVQRIIEAAERDVIIDGHYAVDVVPAKDVNTVFVLRRNPDELKKAMEARGFSEKKLWENLAAEILDVCLWEAVSACGYRRVCEIDVSGKKIQEIVDEASLVLERKKKCKVGIVDWLGKLDREGRLHDFLKPF